MLGVCVDVKVVLVVYGKVHDLHVVKLLERRAIHAVGGRYPILIDHVGVHEFTIQSWSHVKERRLGGFKVGSSGYAKLWEELGIDLLLNLLVHRLFEVAEEFEYLLFLLQGLALRHEVVDVH